MCHGLALNLGDANTRVKGTMSGLLAESLAAPLLENAHLRAPGLAVDDPEHFHAADERGAGHNFSAVPRQKQYLIEGHFRARIGGPAVELDGGARRDLYLTAPGLNNGVHGHSPLNRKQRIISHRLLDEDSRAADALGAESAQEPRDDLIHQLEIGRQRWGVVVLVVEPLLAERL